MKALRTLLARFMSRQSIVCIFALLAMVQGALHSATGADAQTSLTLSIGSLSNPNWQATALSADGSFGVTASLQRFAAVDTNTGVIIRQISTDKSWVRGLAIDPRNRFVISVGTQGAIVWSLPSLEKVKDLLVDEDLQAVAISNDANRAAVAGFSGRTYVWNTVSMSELYSPEVAK